MGDLEFLLLISTNQGTGWLGEMSFIALGGDWFSLPRYRLSIAYLEQCYSILIHSLTEEAPLLFQIPKMLRLLLTVASKGLNIQNKKLSLNLAVALGLWLSVNEICEIFMTAHPEFKK